MSEINAKLLAACERVVRLHQEGLLGKQNDSVAIGILESTIAAVHTQAADDAMPVDKEWLLSIGFEVHDGDYLFHRWCPVWFLGVRGISVGNSATGWHDPKAKTRGDVRRLLAAFGVKQ